MVLSRMVGVVRLKNFGIVTFRQLKLIGWNGYDTERAQAGVRLIIIPFFFSFLFFNILSKSVPAAQVWLGAIYIAAYIAVSILLYVSIVRWPGIYASRRLFSMSHDYLAMTYAMSAAGESTLPVYAILLWVTVGNGLRFGPRYLIIATAMALGALCITTYFNGFWSDNPSVILTLVATAILVPAYIYVLLARVHVAYSAALEANLAKSRFLAQASHDLRQPIHAISLFIACLRDSKLGADERQMVDNIDRSLQSVSSLFKSLLDISTLDSGKISHAPEVISIGEILQDIVQHNSEVAQRAGVTLKLVATKQYVRIDPSLITTMIQNIISNALKYAPGRPVLIGCRRRQGKLSIEVYDQGEGIAQQHLPRVFEEFYQVRERGDKDIEGVGLGLSIVLRLATLMRLKVSIRSIENQGTVVTIDGLETVKNPVELPRTAQAQPVSLLGGLRVLLIEDDLDVLAATARLLEKWGCIVQQEESLPIGKNVLCDLIITDFDLGAKVTGSDCIAYVRRSNGMAIPAIVVTGHDQNRVRDDLDDAAIPVLSKPVRPAELRSTMLALKLRAKTDKATETAH